MKSPTLKTVKRLFAVSNNRCAFPACESPLVEVTGTITGDIAHIRASSPNGPRYDPAQCDEDRHSFGNLMLLCGRHHTIIDTEINEYSVPTLERINTSMKQRGRLKFVPFTALLLRVYLRSMRVWLSSTLAETWHIRAQELFKRKLLT